MDTKPRVTEIKSLMSADWLTDLRLVRLMKVIAGADEEVRVVGGAIRNWLLDRPVADIDLATTALPKVVMARTRHHDMRPVPTGIDHGTVTVIVEGKPFEVTTLRQDVATDGRRATVKFGRNWAADAMRRDFTVNALYATADGQIIDYVGGIKDCTEHRIRFIGEPEARIREDYLRILRLFRFHANYADGPIDAPALEAATHLKDGILSLSAERIGQELLKLVVASHAPDVISVMHQRGILALALGSAAVDLDRFCRVHRALSELPTAQRADLAQPATLLLASLTANGEDGCIAFALRLRLSNATRDRMVTAQNCASAISPNASYQAMRALIFRAGPNRFRDAVLLANGNTAQEWSVEATARLFNLALDFDPPKPPIAGRDLLALGIEPGQQLGKQLQSLIEMWIASDFILTKQQLLSKLTDVADQ